MIIQVRRGGRGGAKQSSRKDGQKRIFLVLIPTVISTVDEREPLKRAPPRYFYTYLVDGGERDWCLKKKRNGKKARKRNGKKRNGKPHEKNFLCFSLYFVYAVIAGFLPDIDPYL